jgi:hypothetical protein
VAKVSSDCLPDLSGEIEILVRNRPKRRDSFQEDAWNHRRDHHSLSVTIRTPTERLVRARLVPFIPGAFGWYEKVDFPAPGTAAS